MPVNIVVAVPRIPSTARASTLRSASEVSCFHEASVFCSWTCLRGAGDIALSVTKLPPGSELLLVTTPQATAAKVAERAETPGKQTGQRPVE